MLESLVLGLQQITAKRETTNCYKTIASHLFNLCLTTAVIQFTHTILDTPPQPGYKLDFDNKLG